MAEQAGRTGTEAITERGEDMAATTFDELKKQIDEAAEAFKQQ